MTLSSGLRIAVAAASLWWHGDAEKQLGFRSDLINVFYVFPDHFVAGNKKCTWSFKENWNWRDHVPKHILSVPPYSGQTVHLYHMHPHRVALFQNPHQNPHRKQKQVLVARSDGGRNDFALRAEDKLGNCLMRSTAITFAEGQPKQPTYVHQTDVPRGVTILDHKISNEQYLRKWTFIARTAGETLTCIPRNLFRGSLPLVSVAVDSYGQTLCVVSEEDKVVAQGTKWRDNPLLLEGVRLGSREISRVDVVLTEATEECKKVSFGAFHMGVVGNVRLRHQLGEW